MDLKPAIQKGRELLARIFQKNRYERILQDYEDLARQRPKDMRIRIKIAEIYFKAKEIEKTIATYQNVADFYVQENFILKAVAMLKNILKLDPRRREVNLELADLYVKLEMKNEAVGQVIIAMEGCFREGKKDQHLELSQRLVEMDPTSANRRKLAEIFHAYGMKEEALVQYEILAADFKKLRDYEGLLRIYELILAFKPSPTMIRDVCILYLRRQDPDLALRVMERFKVDQDAEFAELFDKAKLMKKALRNAPKGGVAVPATNPA